MRNPILTFQPVSIRWLLLIGVLISLSACSTDEENPVQLASATTEDQVFNKWISNYLDTVASEISINDNLVPTDKSQIPKVTSELTVNEPVPSDSLALGYFSWVEEDADSTTFFTQLVYALPDSLVQQLGDTLNKVELVIDLSVSSASDSASTWLPLSDATNVLQHAALGPASSSPLDAPFLITLPGTLSQPGLPMNRKVDVERLVIPLKLIH